MFDITPFLSPHDPWPRGEDVRRYYPCKHHVAGLLQPKTIAEIGVRAGYSAASFLSAYPTARYFGFDYWGRGDQHGGWDDAKGHATMMLRERFPGAELTFTELDTQGVDRLDVPRPDLFHVDGDHSEAGAYHDLALAFRSGARWILVDDVVHLPPVRAAVQRFVFEHRVGCVFLEHTPRGDVLIDCGAGT